MCKARTPQAHQFHHGRVGDRAQHFGRSRQHGSLWFPVWGFVHGAVPALAPIYPSLSPHVFVRFRTLNSSSGFCAMAFDPRATGFAGDDPFENVRVVRRPAVSFGSTRARDSRDSFPFPPNPLVTGRAEHRRRSHDPHRKPSEEKSRGEKTNVITRDTVQVGRGVRTRKSGGVCIRRTVD